MISFRHSLAATLVFMLAVPAGPVFAETAKSGYEYIKPTTRAMQDDDFENPGMLAVEHGKELFNEKQPGASKSCAECHGDGHMSLRQWLYAPVAAPDCLWERLKLAF